MTTTAKVSEKQAEIPLAPIEEVKPEIVPVVSEVPAKMEPVIPADIPALPSFSNSQSFEHAQRVAKMLATSDLIPQHYRGNIQNCMIALEMANRIGASPLMVMQNLHIIQGKPSWSSVFIISSINACGKFSPLRYDLEGEGDDMKCTAWAYDLNTKEKLLGPTVTMQMAKEEGWSTKSGSKWKSMASLMIRYRAAAFFGRLYAPELLMGMLTSDEAEDISKPSVEDKKAALAERLNQINIA